MIAPPPIAPGYPPPSRTTALAVWSLTLGILSLMCLSIFGAVPAVICGHAALSKIRNSNGAIAGQGLAIGGLVTGYLGLMLAAALLPWMITVGADNFVKARNVARAKACLQRQEELEVAKYQWALDQHKQAWDTPTAADLKPYLKHAYTLYCPVTGKYTISGVGGMQTCPLPEHRRNSTSAAVKALREKLARQNSSLQPGPDGHGLVLQWDNGNPNPAFGGRMRAATNQFKPAPSRAVREQLACDMNRRLIQVAKQIWSHQNHKQSNDVPNMNDLLTFLPNHRLPACPAGGDYTIGAVGSVPVCSLPEHSPPTEKTNNPATPPAR